MSLHVCMHVKMAILLQDHRRLVSYDILLEYKTVMEKRDKVLEELGILTLELLLLVRSDFFFFFFCLKHGPRESTVAVRSTPPPDPRKGGFWTSAGEV